MNWWYCQNFADFYSNRGPKGAQNTHTGGRHPKKSPSRLCFTCEKACYFPFLLVRFRLISLQVIRWNKSKKNYKRTTLCNSMWASCSWVIQRKLWSFPAKVIGNFGHYFSWFVCGFPREFLSTFYISFALLKGFRLFFKTFTFNFDNVFSSFQRTVVSRTFVVF